MQTGQNLPVFNSHTENCGKKQRELFHQERVGKQGTILCHLLSDNLEVKGKVPQVNIRQRRKGTIEMCDCCPSLTYNKPCYL